MVASNIHFFQGKLIRFIRNNLHRLPSIVQKPEYPPNSSTISLYLYQLLEEKREHWRELSDLKQNQALLSASKYFFILLFSFFSSSYYFLQNLTYLFFLLFHPCYIFFYNFLPINFFWHFVKKLKNFFYT